MATVTPNYGWDVPTSTDYVKDGATAIETLGDDIDASLFSITGGKNVGMVHINTTSVTSASTLSVDNCFTSAYNNYRLVLNITSMTAGSVRVRFRTGAGDISLTNYGWIYGFSVGSNSWTVDRNLASDVGLIAANTGQTELFADILCVTPQATAKTGIVSNATSHPGTILDLGATGYGLTTSFSGISILATSFTGTLQIYGLRNS